MAVSAALVTSGEGESTADATSYLTASVSPPSSQLLLLAVGSGCTTTGGADTDPSSVTGCGVTWVLVDGQQQASGGTAGNQRVSVFRAMGTTSTGQITINYSETQHNCSWRLIAFDGVETSGTNGSGAIGLKGKNTFTGPGTQPSVTLGSLSSGSGTYSAVIGNSTTNAFTAGSGFTEYGDQANTNPGTPSTRMACEFSASGTNPVNWTVGATTQYGILAIEIIAAPAVISKSGSDTLNLDEDETSTTLAINTGTDSLNLDEDEVGSSIGTATATDSLNLVVTETQASTLFTDIGGFPGYDDAYGGSGYHGLAVTETSSVVVLTLVAGADTLNLDENETSATTISTVKTGADNLNLDENETSTTQAIFTGADSVGLDENESSVTTAQLSDADAVLGLDANESGEIAGQFTPIAGADTLGLDQNETSTTQAGVVGANTLGLDENESGSIIVTFDTKTGADTLNLDIQESTGIATTTGTYPSNTTFPGGDLWPHPGAEVKSVTDTLGLDISDFGVVAAVSGSQEYWGVLQI